MEKRMVYKRPKFEHFMDRLMPGACYLCRGTARGQTIICPDCRDDLPVIRDACPKCGNPWTRNSGCRNCRLGPFPVDSLVTPYHYQYPVNELIRQLKYRQKLILSQELGRAIARHSLKVCTSLPEVLIPIPLHRTRQIARGFNQAAEIANAVGRELSIPVNSRLLQRRKNTLAQFDLEPAARKHNIKDAFTLRTGPHYECVALIDDVITTGATVNEAARLLKRAGVRRVEAWACARADG